MWKHSRKQELRSMKPHKRTCADGRWKPQRQILTFKRLISRWHAHCFSDHAICYACIFSSAFEMMTHHWLVHKISMGLAVTTAFTLRIRFTCESSSKVSRATNQPPVGSSIQLIYDVIRKSEKSCQVNTHKNKHKDFLWSVTKLQAHIKNFLNKKRCYSWQIIIVYWMEQEYRSDRNINLDTH